MPKKKQNADAEVDDEKEVPYRANPKSMDGVPDLSMLVYMEMKNVLYNCEHRYNKMTRKYCYTSVSTILLAINPYERLPIYGQDVINEFHEAQKKGRLPQGRPHPYGVSARSYMRMIQRKCNQSVVVCGESGAGKTETTKLLMRYLAMTAPSASMEQSIVEQQIIAASPILEAYGNAKTVLNNNSSRFGKFTKLLYDVPEKAKFGTILGSYLETYLLEKSRVVYQSHNERNYHIPYFLYHGLPKDRHDEFGIVHPDKWLYANQGGAVEVPGINDLERYKELAESLKLMRIDENIQVDLWGITTGIFNLGNISFKREGDGFASIDAKSSKFLKNLSKLWGLSEKAITDRLTTASLRIMKKTVVKKVTFDDAPTNRDSIAKGIYENVFLYLCERINAELYQTDEEDMKSILFIGILDVFGFENFWINSLEQFCINFTNEKLQQFFNYHIIRSEQEEYIKESVFWKPLTVPDNLEYINFVEKKDIGFYTLLDSACKAPQPSTEAFMQTLFKKHGDKKCIKQIKKPGSGNARGGPKKKKRNNRKNKEKFDGFEIKHFADTVAYDITKFLVKNMEAVHSDTAKMMKKSKSVLVKEIGGTGPKGRKKKSVTAVFHGGIKTLMKNLHATEPYFVRCVNPNMQKSSTIWDEKVVEHQLRCGGLVEALKVLKLGYPTRVPYSELYDRYHGNVTNPLIKNMGPEAFSTALLIAFDVSEEDYELGLTKIFFKPAKAAVLDTIMAQAGKPLSPAQNDKITKWVVQKRIKQMVGTCRSFLELRKRVRLTRAEARWRNCGRVAALLGGTVCVHLKMARRQILERKRLQGAMAMQSFFRGAHVRIEYIRRIGKIIESTKVIWSSYRSWRNREKLQEWLDIKVEETRIREEAQRRREAELARKKLIEEERKKAQMAEEERRKKAEELRLEKERQKQAELEKIREQQRKDREEAERIRQEEEKKEQERLQEEARKAQEKEAAKLAEEKAKQEREQHEEERQQREAAVAQAKEDRLQTEETIKEQQEQEFIQKNFSEMVPDSDSEYSTETDSEYSTDEDDQPSLKEQLKNFDKIAMTGQLFLKYTGKRRRKPQDRIVKVSFDNKFRPKQISWGSGSRHIDFSDILYVSWGHWTPVFDARRDQLDEKMCFSVVGKQQILDIQAQSKEMAELWVKGLRKLCNQTDEKSDKLAKQAFESGNLPGHRTGHGMTETKKQEREHKKRTKSLMLLQQDLFVMTTTTVFRNLEEERIWDIDQSVRERFNAKSLYELALREDIPWRQWNHWVREKIVTFLRENNRIAAPQTFNNGMNGMNGMYVPQQQMPPQYMQHQRHPSYGHLPPQNNMYAPPQQQQQFFMPPQQQQQQMPQMQNFHMGTTAPAMLNDTSNNVQTNGKQQQQQQQQQQGKENGDCSLM